MSQQPNLAYPRRRWGAVVVLTLASALMTLPATALAESNGGTGPSPTAPGADAQLLPNGDAAPPAGAPPQVVRAIEYANRINNKPYRWGGGHSSWKLDRGYDCSGAVSYMLHGADALKKSPLDSGSLAKWGIKGEGQWISVYANGGHAYAVVAGLRWDTSGGKGPRWHSDMRSAAGFRVRHPDGL